MTLRTRISTLLPLRFLRAAAPALLIGAVAAAPAGADSTISPSVVFTEKITESETYVGIINDRIGAVAFYDVGVFGQLAKVANIEAQHPWLGHVSLEHIPTANLFSDTGTGAVATTSHAYHPTAVSQIIAGQGAKDENGYLSYINLGVAPGATFYSGAIANKILANGGFDISVASLMSTYTHFFAEEKVDVINSSWGSTGPGDKLDVHDWIAPAIDGLVCTNPRTTMVVAAGNSGKKGSNTVAAPAVGFNVIAVGALSQTSDYTAVANFSSYGPSNFYNPDTKATITAARATVHLVTAGENIWGAADTSDPGLASQLTELQKEANDLYFTQLDGTSFAAPIVAGGATLLASVSHILEDRNDPNWSTAARDARVIKAVLLNSAAKLPGWNNATATTTATAKVSLGAGISIENSFGNVRLTTQALDYKLGAGALDLAAALDQYLGHNADWVLDTVAANDEYLYQYVLNIPADATLAVTLTWFAETLSTDGTDTDALEEDDFAYSYLADLNLEVWSVDMSGMSASLADLLAASRTRYDTVEHLYLDFAESTQIALRVVHNGAVFGVPAYGTDETFALAWRVINVPEPGTYGIGIGAVAAGLLLFSKKRKNKKRNDDGEGVGIKRKAL